MSNESFVIITAGNCLFSLFLTQWLDFPGTLGWTVFGGILMITGLLNVLADTRRI